MIVDCIENPEVDSVLLHPGRSIQLGRGNSPDFGSPAEKITGMPNEDIIPNEGEIRYDIRFSVYRPSEKLGILESDFSIEVTDKMREEMNIMCNLWNFGE